MDIPEGVLGEVSKQGGLLRSLEKILWNCMEEGSKAKTLRTHFMHVPIESPPKSIGIAVKTVRKFNKEVKKEIHET